MNSLCCTGAARCLPHSRFRVPRELFCERALCHSWPLHFHFKCFLVNPRACHGDAEGIFRHNSKRFSAHNRHSTFDIAEGSASAVHTSGQERKRKTSDSSQTFIFSPMTSSIKILRHETFYTRKSSRFCERLDFWKKSRYPTLQKCQAEYMK